MTAMDRYEKTKQQVLVLRELLDRFGGKTLDNVHTNLVAELNELEKEKSEKPTFHKGMRVLPPRKEWDGVLVSSVYFGNNVDTRIKSACRYNDIVTLGDLRSYRASDLKKKYQIGFASSLAIRRFFLKQFNYEWDNEYFKKYGCIAWQ